MNEIIQDELGIWTAKQSLCNPPQNAINRTVRFKALNYHLFQDLSGCPTSGWFPLSLFENVDEIDKARCICGQDVQSYWIVERGLHKVCIGSGCVKQFDDEYSSKSNEAWRQLIKFCVCKNKKKKMTDDYCKECIDKQTLNEIWCISCRNYKSIGKECKICETESLISNLLCHCPHEDKYYSMYKSIFENFTKYHKLTSKQENCIKIGVNKWVN
jgi:hypothetical protein